VGVVVIIVMLRGYFVWGRRRCVMIFCLIVVGRGFDRFKAWVIKHWAIWSRRWWKIALGKISIIGVQRCS